jgi:hypothetical protein
VVTGIWCIAMFLAPHSRTSEPSKTARGDPSEVLGDQDAARLGEAAKEHVLGVARWPRSRADNIRVSLPGHQLGAKFPHESDPRSCSSELGL